MSDPAKFNPKIEPLDLRRVRSIPIAERRNKVRVREFAGVPGPHCTTEELLASLPRLLAADELRAAAECTARTIERGAPVVLALGGHVVKAGLAPVIIDLMERGCVSALAMNGATAIHDYEIGLIGETSEDVTANIADGRFGMARETAVAYAAAATRAAAAGRGLGEALGAQILAAGHPDFLRHSLLAAATRLEIPATVHVALGTDVVHMHPEMDGAALGAASLYDFRLLAGIATRLAGGVWMNLGSAVVLPEIFLKVVNLARNVGYPLRELTAINFDMLQHYRTSVNVLRRPVERGISITGHHEINIPLFRVALLLELKRAAARRQTERA
ncbi:MAG: hypothetical protein ACKVX7_01180 [Planctomycetota bacterium]